MSVVRTSTPAARCCVKGREAPAGLAAAGIATPSRPNAWNQAADGTWCLRLGAGEFLLAHDDDSAAVERLSTLLAGFGPSCHVLLRSDACVHLEGPRATERLLQVCDIDERRFAREPDAVALVQLADVSVALQATVGGYRIWCDPTWLSHLVETFHVLDARSTPRGTPNET